MTNINDSESMYYDVKYSKIIKDSTNTVQFLAFNTYFNDDKIKNYIIIEILDPKHSDDLAFEDDEPIQNINNDLVNKVNSYSPQGLSEAEHNRICTELQSEYRFEKMKGARFKNYVQKNFKTRMQTRLNKCIIKKLEDLRSADLIMQNINNHKSTNVSLLIDFVNESHDLEVYSQKNNPLVYYRKEENGFFKQFDEYDLRAFLGNYYSINAYFRLNSVKTALHSVSNVISVNYDLICFSNGCLNTDTQEFSKEYPEDELSKLYLDFPYYHDANDFLETKLYKEIEDILRTDRRGFEDNTRIFYQAVGNIFMRTNKAQLLYFIVGHQNTRKSTLLEIIKRCVGGKASHVPFNVVCENKEFKTLPLFDKAVNIDDDISSKPIEDVSAIKKLTTGGTLEVELKKENKRLYLTNETTPKFWTACNDLPVIKKTEGFRRRFCLILADNPIRASEDDKSYMENINEGKRDEEIGLMVSYCINLFFELGRDIISPIQQQHMLREYKNKSNYLDEFISIRFFHVFEFKELLEKKGIKYKYENHIFFINDFDDVNFAIIPDYLHINTIFKYCKKELENAFENNLIFEDQKNINNNQLKKILENKGFSIERVRGKKMLSTFKKLDIPDNYLDDFVVDMMDNRCRLSAYGDCVFLNDDLLEFIK